MPSQYLFDKVSDLKDKLKNFFTHKKKLKALNTYSEVVPFQHRDYLKLIKKCMADGFLGDKEAEFLCYLLEKYELNYLDWSHKTKWLKEEMNRLERQYNKPRPVQGTFFDLDKPNIPMPENLAFNAWALKQKQASKRV